jgi:hypothetical protein
MRPALNAVTLPGLGALTLPSFNTHVPFVGTVDLKQPMEWVFWGGMIVDLVFVKGISKWIIAAGIIAARYELGQRGSK